MALTRTSIDLTDLKVVKQDLDNIGDTSIGTRSGDGFAAVLSGTFDRTGTDGSNFSMEAQENNSKYLYIKPGVGKYPTYDKAFYTMIQDEVITVNKSNVSQVYVLSGQVTLELETPVQVNAENNYEIPAATELDITADAGSVIVHIWKT